MRRNAAVLPLACLALSAALLLCGAGVPQTVAPDFDQHVAILGYINSGERSATLYEHTLMDGYSQQYACRELTATAYFSEFGGAERLLELELDEPATIGFQIAADVAGPYKVVVLSGEDNILLTASSAQWQQASRPIEAPAGRISVLLVAEAATGGLRISLHPPTNAILIGQDADQIDT